MNAGNNVLVDSGKKLLKFFRILPDEQPDLSYIRPNGVLRTRQEYQHAMRVLKKMGMLLCDDRAKNWDTLAALALIRKYFPAPETAILDAGGEYYSCIMPSLHHSGYVNLRCINLVFMHPFRKGNILFEYGDITRTKFKDGTFEAITCLSVIEHGVDMNAYFKEMSRILKPGGILFTSTDYWQDHIDTENKEAYGCPIKIFTAEDIRRFIRIAEFFGFESLAPLELDCVDKVVAWPQFNLHYTFVYFLLRKRK